MSGTSELASIVADILAYADSVDTTNASIAMLVISTGILALAIGASLAPMCLAWRRRMRNADTLVPLAIVWALATAAVSIYAYVSQTRWNHEYLLRIASGYYDPRDRSDAPSWPWLYWYVLGMCFVLLILWAATGKRRQVEELPAE